MWKRGKSGENMVYKATITYNHCPIPCCHKAFSSISTISTLLLLQSQFCRSHSPLINHVRFTFFLIRIGRWRWRNRFIQKRRISCRQDRGFLLRWTIHRSEKTRMGRILHRLARIWYSIICNFLSYSSIFPCLCVLQIVISWFLCD